MGKKRVAHRTWIPTTRNGCQIVEDEPLPPIHYYHKVDHQAILEKSELPLEEKFCLLGGISWHSVLAAQKYIDCHHENVLKWDDSGAKDALYDAHERFVAMINSLPCEHPLPDPDMYIDNIDWNAEIDPGLIADMEKENRYPDEAENSTDNKISGCSEKNKTNVDKPWESPRVEVNVDVKDLAQTWNKCGDVKDNGVTSDEALKDKKLNEPNSNCPTNQNNDIEKIDSGMHSRACRKREEYQENTKRRKSQKQGADPESQQFLGKGRPQTRYNLRPRKLVEYTMSGTVIILREG
ncbi:hypothetical protein POM88_051093 [Heracleum sosnowskyi]|uniref:Uncharacterized protein n=1 Tax=Heracleum sosnowskyi TaxID=360622 RepID=A0AAD8H196_9APIA|nr:hypothetical protein POM88_051093 [Heracleum sosnowskyi]